MIMPCRLSMLGSGAIIYKQQLHSQHQYFGHLPPSLLHSMSSIFQDVTVFIHAVHSSPGFPSTQHVVNIQQV